jgi:hypothetical protein
LKALSLKAGRQSTLLLIDRTFAKDVLPSLARLSVFEIKRVDVLDVLRRIERRQATRWQRNAEHGSISCSGM